MSPATKACNMILGIQGISMCIQFNIFVPAVGETGDAQVCVPNFEKCVWNYVKLCETSCEDCICQLQIPSLSEKWYFWGTRKSGLM